MFEHRLLIRVVESPRRSRKSNKPRCFETRQSLGTSRNNTEPISRGGFIVAAFPSLRNHESGRDNVNCVLDEEIRKILRTVRFKRNGRARFDVSISTRVPDTEKKRGKKRERKKYKTGKLEIAERSEPWMETVRK